MALDYLIVERSLVWDYLQTFSLVPRALFNEAGYCGERTRRREQEREEKRERQKERLEK